MPIKVLIVDDHEIVRSGLRSVLGLCSEVEVVGEAFDGIDAISKAIEYVPDLILMDIRMPRMNGIVATRQIKDNLQLQNTRVLMFTSNESEADLFASLAAGANGYCLKDTAAKELVLAIQTVHSGAAWLDPQIARLVLRTVTPALTEAASPKPAESPSFGLSRREIEILRLLVDGLSNVEMADKLTISPETIKTHMKRIMEKLQVDGRTQAAVKAMREGLI
jgi:DNA-binding NarL/FixJ family response regulator